MTISYMCGYYAHLTSCCVQAGHTQLESVINPKNPVNLCERSSCRDKLVIMHTLNINSPYSSGQGILSCACINRTGGDL